MTTAALIPVKALGESKQRLAGVLSPDERKQLTLAMLADVMQACRDAELEPLTVVSPDKRVLALARQVGATAIAEDDSPGLNRSVARGLKALAGAGAKSVLVVLADVPMVAVDDLRTIAERVERGGVVVARARDGGTPVLGLPMKKRMRTRFGPDSARRHAEAAAAAGLDVEVLDIPSLSWDLDLPQDLARYLAEGPENRSMQALRSFGLPAAVRSS